MSEAGPVLQQLDLVVRDIDASVAFYRQLGIAIPDGAVWRVGEHGHHAHVEMPTGFTFSLDSVALGKAYNAGLRADNDDERSTVIVGFSVATREEVDELYADLTAAGHTGRQPPYDAFWGARYAIVADPDGNDVGIMSPADPARRTAPPNL